VDIGGTFTDVVLELPGAGRVTTKLLTTYTHPGEAVLKGIGQVLQQAGLSSGDIGLIIHGTTLATNALIERRGARTALLTTEGHRDALEMAHEDRFEQYDINIDRPRPLVPRHLRLPVHERLDCNGRVLIPLNEDSIESALPVLEEHGVESVAIGYLHAFVNPQHELRTAELLQAARPDLSITLASEVCPEIREFERLSTACANAYVRPLMSRYLERLAGELQQMGFSCPFLMMTSGGGLTTLETATKFPIRLVESGPAGGAILAQQVARYGKMKRLLSFDMGGTTAKLCLIDDYQPLTSRSFEVDRVYRFKKGSGLPVRIPVIEMVEIGAGGGSIAHIDRLKRIQARQVVVEREADVLRQANNLLRQNESERQAELGQLQSELDFYRRLAGTGGAQSGLDIYRVEVIPTDSGRVFQFILTLTQNIRRAAIITGRARVDIEGTMEDRPVTLYWSQVSDGETPEPTFRFKYFQQLERLITLPEGFEANQLTVRLRSGSLRTPVEQSMEWASLFNRTETGISDEVTLESSPDD